MSLVISSTSNSISIDATTNTVTFTAPGPRGAAGPAPTIAIGTVGSVPYGTPPAVRNTGTAGAAIFDFDLEIGQTGPAGTATVTLGTALPLMAGTAAAGTSTSGAHDDHRHPTDTSRAADNAVVKLTGDQTVAGIKTWTGRQHFHAPIELYVASANPANPETGDVYYNDQINQVRYYDGNGWHTVMCLDDAQTISGVKTFSAAPVVPTQTAGDSSTKAASTAFVTGGLAGKLALVDLPYSALVTMFQIPNAASSTFAFTGATAYLSGYGYTGTSKGVYVEWTFVVAAGTYSLRYIYSTSSAGGIASISLDDGAALTTTPDQYTAATVHNNLLDITGIALTAGRHTIRLTGSEKNASSTGYRMHMSVMSFTRTGA